MNLVRMSAALVGLGLVVGACSGDSSPTGTTNPPGNQNPPPARTILTNPSFATNIQEIFDRRGCSTGGCHGTPNNAGLTLTSGQSYTNLVNVQATSEPIVRVIPNNADGSYLVIKLEGRQQVGAQMPFGGAALDNIDLTNIKNWINTGAPNN